MADSIANLLQKDGPMRGALLAAALQAGGLSPEAARQRLSRARAPVRKFPLRLLPKKEAFYYLQDQRNRDISEMIVLDALREWARKLGFAGYNTIAIRSEPQLKPIGPFAFDLAGPSWFAPLQQGVKPGFLGRVNTIRGKWFRLGSSHDEAERRRV